MLLAVVRAARVDFHLHLQYIQINLTSSFNFSSFILISYTSPHHACIRFLFAAILLISDKLCSSIFITNRFLCSPTLLTYLFSHIISLFSLYRNVTLTPTAYFLSFSLRLLVIDEDHNKIYSGSIFPIEKQQISRFIHLFNCTFKKFIPFTLQKIIYNKYHFKSTLQIHFKSANKNQLINSVIILKAFIHILQ